MSHVLEQLVEMSRYLGDPAKDYAILGEGNTSACIDDDTFYVSASGTTLATADHASFIAVSSSKILALLDAPNANDIEVTRVLREATIDKQETRRPSVEAVLHAVLLREPDYAFVAHTHPVHTNMLLCSNVAEEAVSGRIFPDQIVHTGHKSVFVPYTDPGLKLAREVKRRLEDFRVGEGMLPKIILVQNHGLITMGDSPQTVMSRTDMTENASKILVGAYAAGGPHFMAPADVAHIFNRPEEA